jgi:hypothetical protein
MQKFSLYFISNKKNFQKKINKQLKIYKFKKKKKSTKLKLFKSDVNQLNIFKKYNFLNKKKNFNKKLRFL